jgi:hypothetical protein
VTVDLEIYRDALEVLVLRYRVRTIRISRDFFSRADRRSAKGGELDESG